MRILCVIPVYNEHDKLISLIDQIKKNDYAKFNFKYLFINNGSNDDSLDIIKKNNIDYLHLKKNKGVGYALMLGFLFAKKYNYKFIIHLAGNGKMKPSEIINFINLAKKNEYDFVSGSRFLKGSSKKNNPIIRVVMIRFFSVIINLFLKKNITDSTCGFRMIRTEIFKNFKKNFFKKDLFTYGYEYFSFGKVLRSENIRFLEIPVSMDYPSKKNYSKIRPVIDWYIIAKFWIKGIFDKSAL